MVGKSKKQSRRVVNTKIQSTILLAVMEEKLLGNSPSSSAVLVLYLRDKWMGVHFIIL